MDGIEGPLFNAEPKTGGKTDAPQHPQWIVGEGAARFQGCGNKPLFKVFKSTEGIQ